MPSPSPVSALIATASATPIRRASCAALTQPSSARSVLVSTSATGTPPAAASAAKRSSRRAFGSGSGSVTSARSTFAASTCPAGALLAGRAPDDRAGAARDAAIAPPVVDADPVAGHRRLAQPPAGGHQPRLASSAATSQWPRYCASTRARVVRNERRISTSNSQKDTTRCGHRARRPGARSGGRGEDVKAVRHGREPYSTLRTASRRCGPAVSAVVLARRRPA